MPDSIETTRAVVWKYDIAHGQPIQVPAGARLLSVAWESPSVRLYVLADPELPKLRREVALIPTGGEIIGDGWHFAGTVLATAGRVFHVFLSGE